MTKNEKLVRSILGPARVDVRLLVFAIDIVVEIMFFQGVPMDEIFVTKDVYPSEAQITRSRPSSAVRRIERLLIQYIDYGDAETLEKVFGRKGRLAFQPHEILFCLAYYSHFGKYSLPICEVFC